MPLALVVALTLAAGATTLGASRGGLSPAAAEVAGDVAPRVAPVVAAAALVPGTGTSRAADRRAPAPLGPVGPLLVPGPEESVTDVPEEAAASYQLAEVVLGASRVGCAVPWTVLAAMGRVTSDHGLVRPGRPTAGRLRDTDRGAVDGSRRRDRPVGPLRLLPQTWARVAVDADDDGVRDPRDLDDATLGLGVLLCSLEPALREPGRRPGALARALRQVRPEAAYVRTVLRTARGYRADVRAGAAVPTAPVVVEHPPPEPIEEDAPDEATGHEGPPPQGDRRRGDAGAQPIKAK
ncbi:lytic transglycosylase domain-containing protein [Nocardioides litoris]|uniref:lytic transglycosylase domain-containing protein n=1 Tax=Nocardioides litoris TaxID=1926648 RepID=UPI0011220704|nr:lytic transglycosylase domain-containing protein [Nocardioides litoris]